MRLLASVIKFRLLSLRVIKVENDYIILKKLENFDFFNLKVIFLLLSSLLYYLSSNKIIFTYWFYL